MILAPRMFGHRVAWCNDPKQHEAHSRYNHQTGETTWCRGTDSEEARMWECERAWSQSDYND